MTTSLPFDALFVVLLAGLAIWAPAPALPVLVLLLLVWGVCLLPAMGRAVPRGHLRRDLVFTLLGLFLLAMPVGRLSGGARLWWVVATAGLLVILGVANTLTDRRQGQGFSRLRKELTLATVVLLAASVLVGAVARGLLAFRSTMAIPPGSLDFLVVMSIWAGAWFGLDSALRRMSVSKAPGFPGWLWNRRHCLGLVLVCGLIYLREGLS
jgi:hypothetical protein